MNVIWVHLSITIKLSLLIPCALKKQNYLVAGSSMVTLKKWMLTTNHCIFDSWVIWQQSLWYAGLVLNLSGKSSYKTRCVKIFGFFSTLWNKESYFCHNTLHKWWEKDREIGNLWCDMSEISGIKVKQKPAL